jgi:hypothetical protein
VKRALAVVALLAAAACNGGSSSSAPSTPAQSTPASPTPTAVAAAPQQAAIAPALLANPGIASTTGPGPLTASQVQKLLQHFEDKVAAAYAQGDADALYRVLAGPMLNGNRATVKLLSSKGTRNVFRITVGPVTLDTNDPTRIIAEAPLDETVDYYVAQGKVQNGGLPGPARMTQEFFLDLNPANSTWYWTGVQDASKAQGAITPAK